MTELLQEVMVSMSQRQGLQPPGTDVEREVIMAAAMHTTVANVSNSVVARVAK